MIYHPEAPVDFAWEGKCKLLFFTGAGPDDNVPQRANNLPKNVWPKNSPPKNSAENVSAEKLSNGKFSAKNFTKL